MRTLNAADFAALEFVGPHTRNFLHAQLATDLRKQTPGSALHAALLAANGRVLAAGTLLIQSEECWFWLLDRPLLEAIAAHLRRYVLRSKLRITVRQDMHLWQNPTEQPSAGLQFYDMAERKLALLDAAPATTPELDLEFATQAIHQGVLDFAAEHSDRFLPQALGLQRTGAIALDKGCYPGQEIVARMHYLGRAKRSLARYASTTQPSSAELLDHTGRQVAELLNMVEVNGQWIGLASVQTDLQTTQLATQSGSPPFQLQVLE